MTETTDQTRAYQWDDKAVTLRAFNYVEHQATLFATPAEDFTGLSDAEIWRRARAIPGWESDALVAHEQAAAGQHMSLEELRRRRRR